MGIEQIFLQSPIYGEDWSWRVKPFPFLLVDLQLARTLRKQHMSDAMLEASAPIA
jgi:hypothetical protein